MRILIIALIAGSIGWAGLGTAWHLCYIKGKCGIKGLVSSANNGDQEMGSSEGDGNNEAFEEELISNQPLDIMELGSPMYTFPESPAIKKGEETVHVPEVTLPLADSIAMFLAANPDKDFEIIGFYDPTETNGSAEANLGLARAKYLKSMLVEKGVPEGRIVVQGVESEMRFTKNAENYNAFEMGIIGQGPDGEGELELVDVPISEEEKASMLEHKYLYANYGDHKFREDKQLNAFIKLLSKELKDNPGAMVKITGHTDHLGKATSNIKLGQRRADYTKEYFVKHGLDPDRIETSSRGEHDPIGENTNRAGRKMNRRIEIIVQ